jgi:type II secretory pathway predicted ATPase ExeA
MGDVGSGKTSLVRAGLIPLLRNSSENWLPLYIRLGRQPVRQLATVLQPILKHPESLFNTLYSNRQALSELVSEITANGTRLLLVIDDLEALFNYASVADRVYMLDLLYHTIQKSSGTFAICLVMQTGYKKRLQEYPNWNRLLEGNLVTMPPLEQADWVEIVQKPAAMAGVSLDETLTHRIVEDVTRLEKPGALSLLSFELFRLFESGNPTLNLYDAHGGVSDSFSQSA